MTTTRDQVSKIDFVPSNGNDRAKSKDGKSNHSKQQRKMSRQRSICSPRRLMNSPPPKQTPPIPTEDLAHNPRGSLSPSPRRISTVSVSTPLYVINNPPAEQRPTTPCLPMSRPVLLKMATITSPTLSRWDFIWWYFLFLFSLIK